MKIVVLDAATLGADLKRTDNAEAQREKEKVTLYTRARLVEPLQACLATLAETAVRAVYEAAGEEVGEIRAEASFGDYGSPSFDSQIRTVALAVEKGVMSVEAAVEELYGDTRGEEWKAAEVRRIRAEKTERR